MMTVIDNSLKRNLGVITCYDHLYENLNDKCIQ